MIKVITERNNGRLRVQHVCADDGRTEKSHRKACNVNTIVAKTLKTGNLPIATRQGVFGDFTSGLDFQESMDRIIKAQHEFMELPASIRKRFGNDPSLLIEFMNDASNQEEAITLGLVPRPVPEPVPVGEPNVEPSEASQ